MVQYLLEFPHIPSHVLTLLASASEKWWNGGKNRNNPFILKFPGFRDIIKTLAFIQSGTGTQRRSKRDLSGSSVQNKLKARLAWKQGVWWRGCYTPGDWWWDLDQGDSSKTGKMRFILHIFQNSNLLVKWKSLIRGQRGWQDNPSWDRWSWDALAAFTLGIWNCSFSQEPCLINNFFNLNQLPDSDN